MAEEPRASPPAEWAEFQRRPSRFLVHDPVAAGALQQMAARVPHGSLERRWLFREAPDIEEYQKQHRSLVDTLARFAPVTYISELVGDHESYDQARRNPNQVFTRDSLITLPWVPGGYIPAAMRRPLRRPETATMEAAVRSLGLEALVRLPDSVFLEGGDVIPHSRDGERTLLVGVGRRSNRASLDFLCQSLVPEFADEILGVFLAPYRMNLDGGLMPVSAGVLVADVDSLEGGLLLDRRGSREFDRRSLLDLLATTVIETNREESVYSQSCNCVALGGDALAYYDLCARVEHLLIDAGVQVQRVPGSELVKGRGGPRCMTRPIYL